MDKFGRILKGRTFDLSATRRYYSEFYKGSSDAALIRDKYTDLKENPVSKRELAAFVKRARKSEMTEFLKYMKAQAAAGRAPIKMKKGLRDFAAPFGATPPKGSKVAMLPRKFAKGLDLRGGVPKFRTKTLETQIHFLDFLTPDFLDELEEMDEYPDEQRDMLAYAVRNFIQGLPEDSLYSVTLATGDYAKGSTFDKEKIAEFLTDLLMRFVRSKGVQQLADFAVAVNSIKKRAGK